MWQKSVLVDWFYVWICIQMRETVFVYDDFVPTAAVFFVNRDYHHELHHEQDFKSRCRDYVTPTYVTHEENSIDSQIPDHTFCLCLLHAKCRLRQNSLISVFELKSLIVFFVVESWVLLRISAPKIWNSLPGNIRDSPSLPTFRRHLKTHYFQLAYIP